MYDMSRQVVDARRLLCPLPVIRTQNAAEKLKPGDVIEVWCTDPGALNDIPAWCRVNGHRLIEAKAVGAEVVVILEVGDVPTRPD